MRVKLSRQGNSLGLIVPAAVVREVALEAGQEYELTVTAGGTLRFSPTVNFAWAPDMSIEDYLAAVPREPLRYEDVPEYVPQGKELDW